jgi:hypothetical protein
MPLINDQKGYKAGYFFIFYLITTSHYDILFFGVNTWFMNNESGKKYTRSGICIEGAILIMVSIAI